MPNINNYPSINNIILVKNRLNYLFDNKQLKYSIYIIVRTKNFVSTSSKINKIYIVF